MQWDGEGLIVGVRRHGESSVIAEVMVEGRGRHLGLIRGGRSSKLAATLPQSGNRGRLAELHAAAANLSDPSPAGSQLQGPSDRVRRCPHGASHYSIVEADCLQRG